MFEEEFNKRMNNYGYSGAQIIDAITLLKVILELKDETGLLENHIQKKEIGQIKEVLTLLEKINKDFP